MESVGFIGGGNMAEALIKGLLQAGICRADEILVSDIRSQRLSYLATEYGVRTFENNKQLAEKSETIVLSIKPQNMAEVLEQIKPVYNTNALIISIAAGIRTTKIVEALGRAPIIRAMPNTPALIGEGLTALFVTKKAAGFSDKAEMIFSAAGRVVFIADEDLMDAVTALSGSGPAYFFLFIEEMIKAGIQAGLKKDTAKKLVSQTARGAVLLADRAQDRGESIAELRRRVTSPGGTTQAALEVFNRGSLGDLIKKAVKAATERGRKLSGD